MKRSVYVALLMLALMAASGCHSMWYMKTAVFVHDAIDAITGEPVATNSVLAPMVGK